ncbi:hypothetical protein L2E82_39690 [Cichorium intybus]|uniref:Uncharacterized protein n=1 Tax=Cichorium intybus TaxID=13427 RepID=A0ACB9AJJ1_CICIN|nr:hypothetical protein L2E82_39690 [Cichorium intybus]
MKTVTVIQTSLKLHTCRGIQSSLDIGFSVAMSTGVHGNRDVPSWCQFHVSRSCSSNLHSVAQTYFSKAPDLGSDNILGVWKIDDTDHSFSSQPFRIRYARQDILLSVMIAFNLSLAKFEGPITSAVILKFELLYTPVLEIGSNMQDSLEVSPAAVHEFRIPPKALLGLHSHYPVHFDAFHAVLIDTTVHISLLKGGVHTMKTPSKAINQTIDLSGFTSQNEETGTNNADSNVPENVSKIPNGSIDTQSEYLYTLQNDELYRLFHSLGDQILYLWSTFLKFHRAEWSVWMVYSKVEMPHQPIRNQVDDSAYHGPRGTVPVLRKITEDPSQAAATRAELHRWSIAQTRINSRSIQDLHIFGDPSRIPIIIVERVVNAPLRTPSGNSYFRNMDPKGINGISQEHDQSLSTIQQKGRVLKIVGHHLDLRLVRNQWLLIDPKVEFLMSEVNEDKTSEDFRDMGLRLGESA